MSNLVPISELQPAALAIAKSGLFGIKTPEHALALMMLAHAEGRNPVEAARDYNIIQGRPSKTAEAMTRDYIRSGGKIQWHKLDDACADATFSHEQGGSVRISWDMERAKQAGLGTKDMWRKYPRQMLRARVLSEGIRTVCPMATSGMYVPEEVEDFERKPTAAAPVETAHQVVDTTTPQAAPTDEPFEDRISPAQIQEIMTEANQRDLPAGYWDNVRAHYTAADGVLCAYETIDELPGKHFAAILSSVKQKPLREVQNG